MYGERNIFTQYAEWLQRLIERPHGLGLQRCYKEMGRAFEDNDVPINERLSMLRAVAGVIRAANARHGSRSSYYTALAVIKAVDETTEDVSYLLANEVLDMLEPDKSLRRYPI